MIDWTGLSQEGSFDLAVEQGRQQETTAITAVSAASLGVEGQEDEAVGDLLR